MSPSLPMIAVSIEVDSRKPVSSQVTPVSLAFRLCCRVGSAGITAELSTAYVTAASDNTARTTFGWTRSDSRSPGTMPCTVTERRSRLRGHECGPGRPLRRAIAPGEFGLAQRAVGEQDRAGGPDLIERRVVQLAAGKHDVFHGHGPPVTGRHRHQRGRQCPGAAGSAAGGEFVGLWAGR